MIKHLSISGFRGFSDEQIIDFVLPNGEKGSGLNIIIGSNNSGKTTIIEAIRAFNSSDSPSFSEGRRNALADSIVKLSIVDEHDKKYTISTLHCGSSTKKDYSEALQYYVVPSRRAVPFEFSQSSMGKDQYISNYQRLENQRTSELKGFASRLFQIEREKNDFDVLLRKVLGRDFEWTIDQRDNGQYYIRFLEDNSECSGEGIGDGIWSVFTICGAMFDAPEGSTIVVDEPELSIHPELQRRMMDLLLDYSQSRQVIISTHSPYFINWEAIANGAGLIRVVKRNASTHCFSLDNNDKQFFRGIKQNINNPHILGLNANEVFLLGDNLILVEGQEDVIIYKKLAKTLNIDLAGSIFGWGVGGASNMEHFLNLFKKLGYQKVVAILDGDKKDIAKQLQDTFTEYKVICLKTDDIRDKNEVLLPAKSGLTDTHGDIKSEYEGYVKSIFEEINSFFYKLIVTFIRLVISHQPFFLFYSTQRFYIPCMYD